MHGKLVTLALQGGGSHGAFTWGVLDRLLEDGRVDIEGISGASAGAMNAVALAYGYTIGGHDGAREALRKFWEGIASSAPFSHIPDEMLWPSLFATQSDLSPAMKALVGLTRFFSPYQLNPFDINPLRDILAAQIDFERLRRDCPIKLFVATTHVGSGTLRVFRDRQLTLDVLLASACLPLLHRAVEIDGEAYWDGGLTANPPLFPLLHKCSAPDVVVVLLHPYPRAETPTTADAISHRLTEMGFSSTFYTELQGVMLAKREAERGASRFGLSWPRLFQVGRLERRLQRLNLHMVESQELMSQLGTHSKLNAHPAFIQRLYQEGRARADAWLDGSTRPLGMQQPFRLEQLFG